jgi:hypothetical protein
MTDWAVVSWRCTEGPPRAIEHCIDLEDEGKQWERA